MLASILEKRLKSARTQAQVPVSKSWKEVTQSQSRTLCSIKFRVKILFRLQKESNDSWRFHWNHWFIEKLSFSLSSSEQKCSVTILGILIFSCFPKGNSLGNSSLERSRTGSPAFIETIWGSLFLLAHW